MHTFLLNFGQQDTVGIFHEDSLPTELVGVGIESCLYGREVMDSVLDWLENTSPPNLCMLFIFGTRIGGEMGERLARFLAREDCNINMLFLSDTDLIGSRNVGTWIECVKRSRSLKLLVAKGMAKNAQIVSTSGESNSSFDPNYDFTVTGIGGNLYWNGTTFPDATMSKEQEEAFKATSSPDKKKRFFRIFSKKISKDTNIIAS